MKYVIETETNSKGLMTNVNCRLDTGYKLVGPVQVHGFGDNNEETYFVQTLIKD